MASQEVWFIFNKVSHFAFSQKASIMGHCCYVFILYSQSRNSIYFATFVKQMLSEWLFINCFENEKDRMQYIWEMVPEYF